MENEELRQEIMSVHEGMEDEKFKPIIEKIKHSDAIEKSIEVSDRFLKKAFLELEGLPDIKARQNLYDIATFIGKRKS